MSSDVPRLSKEQRSALLRFVRERARQALEGTSAAPRRLNVVGRFGGAFVTLRRGSRLRGCVGRFESTTDIVETLAKVTLASLDDPRFASCPITSEELGDITIEVSLLTDPIPTDDPMSLVPGVHGIIVRRDGLSGCLLPKVAVERSWSAEAMLSHCCTMKAGLPANAWRSPEAEVLLFTAEVLSEATSD